jgi:GTPase SAR1 family protein
LRDEGQYLDVAVVGQIKAGKSTFLNALLAPEEEYELPTDFRVLTSKPWCLNYSGSVSDTVVGWGDSGEKRGEWPWWQMHDVQNDETQWDSIRRFEADICSAFLRPLEKVKFWDTPGFDDLDLGEDGQKRMDDGALAEFLTKKEVIVFVCQYDTHTHLDEILEHLGTTQQFVYFITIWNVKRPGAERERKRQEIRDHISERLGVDVPVYAINCKEALKAHRGLYSFPNKLRDALTEFAEGFDWPAFEKAGWADELADRIDRFQHSGIVRIREELLAYLDEPESTIAQGQARLLRDGTRELTQTLKKRLDKKQQEHGRLKRQYDRLLDSIEIGPMTDVTDSIREELRGFLDNQLEKIESRIQKAILRACPAVNEQDREIPKGRMARTVRKVSGAFSKPWFMYGRAARKRREELDDELSSAIEKALDRCVEFFPNHMNNQLRPVLERVVRRQAREVLNALGGSNVDPEVKLSMDSSNFAISLATRDIDISGFLSEAVTKETVREWYQKHDRSAQAGFPAEIRETLKQSLAELLETTLLSANRIGGIEKVLRRAYEEEKERLSELAKAHLSDIQQLENRLEQAQRCIDRYQEMQSEVDTIARKLR